MTWDGRALSGTEAEALRANPESISDLLEQDGAPPTAVDLDKSWHGIHWLLTGDAWAVSGPLAQAIFGGQEFGEDDGYGPPRLLDPAGVTAVAAAMSGIGLDDLRGRLDPVAMSAAEIYPVIWDDADIFDSYLGPNFEKLKGLYAHAAAHEQWVLQYLH